MMWWRHGSVGRGAGLVIEAFVLNAVSHFGAKQSTRCGGPA